MPTNFQPKRLKLKLEVDIVEKPENRVHKLTDSNVSQLKIAMGLAARRTLANVSRNTLSADILKLQFSFSKFHETC